MHNLLRKPAESTNSFATTERLAAVVPIDLANEKHYSIIEIATLWKLSQKTVRKIFEKEPGVILWGHAETTRKRGYRTLRVPETVLQRVHRRLRQAS